MRNLNIHFLTISRQNRKNSNSIIVITLLIQKQQNIEVRNDECNFVTLQMACPVSHILSVWVLCVQCANTEDCQLQFFSILLI